MKWTACDGYILYLGRGLWGSAVHSRRQKLLVFAFFGAYTLLKLLKIYSPSCMG